jgi:3-phosphoshikimate 1-carboxyvinyltransferase
VEKIEIRPVGPVRGRIRPPGSKSITNRALVCAALAEGESLLNGALDSEDTRVMIDALRRIGLDIEHDPSTATIRVVGCGGRLPGSGVELYVANSGTSMRFLTALCTLGRGSFRIDGSPRMRERPIEDLLESLRALGTDATAESPGGCPPVTIHGAGLPGGQAEISGSISSQFLSGLLMAAPYAAQPVTLTVAGELVSKPYVEMTLAVMRGFGAAVEARGLRQFFVPAGRYRGRPYAVEPDASAASYFFAAAAVTGGEVTVEGLSRKSLQGDVAFCDCLARMGCEVRYGAASITVIGRPLRGIEADMNAISDTVQTLGAVALFAASPTTVTGVAHMRHKETDRIAAMATELRKLGAAVEERADGMRITPGPVRGTEIDTYDDHRMAMSFAVAGLRLPGVIIRNPDCASKTYPKFFEDLSRLCGEGSSSTANASS